MRRFNLVLFLAAVLLLPGVYILQANAEEQANTEAPYASFLGTEEGVFGTDSPMATDGNYPEFAVQIGGKSSDVVKVEYYLNGKLVATNTKYFSLDGYSFDTSSYPNGSYALTARVYDAAGKYNLVKSYQNGTEYNFTIKNKAAQKISQPIAQPVSCTKDGDTYNKLAHDIVDRTNAEIEIIRDIAEASNEYYGQLDKTFDAHDQTTSVLSKNKSTVDDALTQLTATAATTCTMAHTNELNAFREAVESANQALVEYRNNVKSFIKSLQTL